MCGDVTSARRSGPRSDAVERLEEWHGMCNGNGRWTAGRCLTIEGHGFGMDVEITEYSIIHLPEGITMARNEFAMSVKKTPGWNPETPIVITEYDTMTEAIAAGQFKDEASVMQAANATRRVARGNRVARALLAKNPTVTAAEIGKAIDAEVYGVRSASMGGSAGPKKAELADALNETKSALSGAKRKADGSVTLTAEQVARLAAKGLI